jgi:hypothetical protein
MAGNVALMLVSADPSAGAGVAAVVGTLALRTDSAQAWQKTSAPDTGWEQVGAGSGDVVGPGSSTDNAIARFDSTTGKLLQNAGVTLSDTNIFATASGDMGIAPSGQLNVTSANINLDVGRAITFDGGSGENLIGGSGTTVTLTAGLSSYEFKNTALDLNANNLTGTRGWMLDLAGDSVVGTSGEHIYSPSDGNIHVVGGTNVDLYSGTDQTLRAGATAVYLYEKLDMSGNDIVDLGSKISGTRGWMLDLSGDSVVGTSGEHIYSDADSSLHIHTGGTTSFYYDTTEALRIGSSIDCLKQWDFQEGARIYDGKSFTFGTGNDAIAVWSTVQTPDALLFGLGSQSNGLIICEKADAGTDFAHALQANPTLFIQSADATSVADWISFAHDQTNGVIATGAGAVVVDGVTGVDLRYGGSTKALIGTSSSVFSTTVRGSANNTYDLGGASNQWKTGYFATSVTGTRGWMLDLSGDSVVGTSGEHIYSSADNRLDFWSGAKLKFQMTANTTDFKESIVSEAIYPAVSGSYQLGTPTFQYSNGFFSGKVTGTRGWMLDLGGDSVVGTSGEHIYSSANDLLDYYSGGDHYFHGGMRFGTHSAIGAETVTGYITIKDSGGTSRKVAVVS